MIVVHHLEDSRSQRILWALEELGVEYEIKHYARHPKTMLAPDELRTIHPLGKSPILTDSKHNLVLAESAAILEYLVETYGRGRLIPPAGTPERHHYVYWMHYAEGSAMPPLLLRLIFDRMRAGQDVPWIAKPIVRAIADKVLQSFVLPNLKAHIDWMESELGKRTWFAGEEFTAADIQMSFPSEAAIARGGKEVGRPRLAAFVERIHARPAYQRALQRGGPFRILS